LTSNDRDPTLYEALDNLGHELRNLGRAIREASGFDWLVRRPVLCAIVIAGGFALVALLGYYF
jgi:hypothetical protein